MDQRWIDEAPNFDGILLVCNISTQTNLTAEQFDSVSGCINNAHAAGWAIVYLFDNGIEDYSCFDQVEGMDFGRLSAKFLGTQLDFRSEDDIRAMLSRIRKEVKDPDIRLEKTPRAQLVGLCTVDGKHSFVGPIAFV